MNYWHSHSLQPIRSNKLFASQQIRPRYVVVVGFARVPPRLLVLRPTNAVFALIASHLRPRPAHKTAAECIVFVTNERIVCLNVC